MDLEDGQDAVVDAEEALAEDLEDLEDSEEAADLSLCDASFSAADSVPTSGHTRLSRCTEKVGSLTFYFQTTYLLLTFNLHTKYLLLTYFLPSVFTYLLLKYFLPSTFIFLPFFSLAYFLPST